MREFSAVAWTGAVLFVVSLAYFSWRYFGAFGVPIPLGPSGAALAANLALFSAFALHHSFLARSGAKRVVTAIIPAPLERVAYVWIASLLFILVCAWWQPVGGLLWRANAAWSWVLRALTLVGVWLTLRSALMLDMFELAGTRPFMRSTARDALVLKSHGPFGVVRHPIYLGWLLLVWPVATMTGTRLVFAAISTLYLVIAVPFEERALVRTFGEDYRDYQQRVRWKILPGIF